VTPEFRPYDPGDRAAVLAILTSNTPDYFAATEADDLAPTLDTPDGPHWVMQEAGVVVGYGGYEVGEVYNRVVLCWGMVARAHHRRGLGSRLLAHRALAAALAEAGRTRWLVVDTTPAVAGFYERFGFERLEHWPQGYRSGFDMVMLRMDLAAAGDRGRAVLGR
jgi:ribosomal protein S18 acetylase RimI-like enzyme